MSLIQSFSVHGIVSMVETEELDYVDIYLEPPDDSGRDIAEDSGWFTQSP